MTVVKENKIIIEQGKSYLFSIYRRFINQKKIHIKINRNDSFFLPYFVNKDIKQLSLMAEKNNKGELSFVETSTIDDLYKLNKIYYFEVVGIIYDEGDKIKKKIIQVRDHDGNTLDVQPYFPLSIIDNPIGELTCKVVQIRNRRISKLIAVNDTTGYKEGEIYEFDYCKTIRFNSANGVSIPLFLIENKENNYYTVKAQPWQLGENYNVDKVKCKVLSIAENKQLKLIQIFKKNEHPFFKMNEIYSFKYIEFYDIDKKK